MDQQLIKRIVEAALLAANQPLTVVQLQALFPLDEPAPDGSIPQALESLQAECAERGVELVELASGWRYQVKADVHAWVARLWTERQTKYTRATLETLALIAYRQPITRGEIEQVRGVAVNSNIIKALEEREWIRVVGHRDIPGRPELLGTTRGFLDYFGLKRLDELPPLSELKDFGELDPQLQFDGKPDAAMPVGDISADGADASPADDVGAGDDEPGHAPGVQDPGAGDDANDADDGSTITTGPAGEAGHDNDDAQSDDGEAADAGAGMEATDGDASNSNSSTDTDIDAVTEAVDQPHANPSQDDTNTDALAAEGDSTGARHE